MRGKPRRGELGDIPVCGESNITLFVYTLPTPLKATPGLYVRFHNANVAMVLLCTTKFPAAQHGQLSLAQGCATQGTYLVRVSCSRHHLWTRPCNQGT